MYWKFELLVWCGCCITFASFDVKIKDFNNNFEHIFRSINDSFPVYNSEFSLSSQALVFWCGVLPTTITQWVAECQRVLWHLKLLKSNQVFMSYNQYLMWHSLVHIWSCFISNSQQDRSSSRVTLLQLFKSSFHVWQSVSDVTHPT